MNIIYKNIVSGMLLIYVVLSPATSLHATEAKDCRLKQYSSLDLLELPDGLLLVPVSIQESRAFMILNTGNAFSAVTNSAAVRLALPTKLTPSGAEMSSGGIRRSSVTTWAKRAEKIA